MGRPRPAGPDRLARAGHRTCGGSRHHHAACGGAGRAHSLVPVPPGMVAAGRARLPRRPPRHADHVRRAHGRAGAPRRAPPSRPVLRAGRQNRPARPARTTVAHTDDRRARLRSAHRRPALQALAIPAGAGRRDRRVLRHPVRQHGGGGVRPWRHPRQLPRAVPVLRGRGGRPRLLRVPRPGAARCDAAFPAPHRPHRPAATLEPGIRADGHGDRGLTQCAGADRGLHRALQSGGRAGERVPLRLRLHLDRHQALRVQLEPRQVSGPRRPDAALPRGGDARRRQPQAVPAGRPSALCRGARSRRIRA